MSLYDSNLLTQLFIVIHLDVGTVATCLKAEEKVVISQNVLLLRIAFIYAHHQHVLPGGVRFVDTYSELMGSYISFE